MISLLQYFILGYISTRICVVEEFDAFLLDWQSIKKKSFIYKTCKIMSHVTNTEFYFDLGLLLLSIDLLNINVKYTLFDVRLTLP